MNVKDISRTRLAELGLSAACLSLIITFFAISPVLLSSLNNSPGGLVFGVGFWIVPSLLALITLYDITSSDRNIETYILGGLSVITILTFLLNLRTILTSPGFLTYGGRGAFFGPLLTLLIGSLIALVVLTSEMATVFSDGKRTKAS